MKAARKEYIKITLPLTKPPAAEQKTVESFNRFFPAGDAYIEIIGNNHSTLSKLILPSWRIMSSPIRRSWPKPFPGKLPV